MLDIAERDMDVPLSDLGCDTGRAFGTWCGRAGRATGGRRRLAVHAGAERPRRSRGRRGQRPVHLTSGCASASLGVLDLLTWHGAGPLPDEADAGPASASSTTGPRAGRAGWTSHSGCARCATRWHASTPGKRVLLVTHEVAILIRALPARGPRRADVLTFAGHPAELLADPLRHSTTTAIRTPMSSAGARRWRATACRSPPRPKHPWPTLIASNTA